MDLKLLQNFKNWKIKKQKLFFCSLKIQSLTSTFTNKAEYQDTQHISLSKSASRHPYLTTRSTFKSTILNSDSNFNTIKIRYFTDFGFDEFPSRKATLLTLQNCEKWNGLRKLAKKGRVLWDTSHTCLYLRQNISCWHHPLNVLMKRILYFWPKNTCVLRLLLNPKSPNAKKYVFFAFVFNFQIETLTHSFRKEAELQETQTTSLLKIPKP